MNWDFRFWKSSISRLSFIRAVEQLVTLRVHECRIADAPERPQVRCECALDRYDSLYQTIQNPLDQGPTFWH